MRALAVLPELNRRHELLIMAGGDAHRALEGDYTVRRLPTFQFQYNRGRKMSNYLTLKKNLPAVLDLWLKGPALDMVKEEFADFQPDVVLSDSEAFTLRAAELMKIPRISFDRFGMLVYCRPEMSTWDRIRCWRDGRVYRWLYGRPERVIVSSFFTAPPRRPGIRVVGPVIRPEVRRIQPSEGEHLVVYFSKAEHEFTPAIERALLDAGCPCRVYGTRRRGMHDNLLFKPIANVPFIEDLASCRAVFATTGNQLLGEVLHFGKPILGLPHASLEQQLNAKQIERLGIGMRVTHGRINGGLIREFLTRVETFKANMPGVASDGATEALDAIERFVAELAGEGAAERTTSIGEEASDASAPITDTNGTRET
jgi:uncharacterized protein (TIGR00661 family)